MNDRSGNPKKPKVVRLDQGHSIAYVDAGLGETLLFVHGSLCDYRYWNPQLLGLSDRFHVVTPSLSHYHPRLPSAADTPFSWAGHTNQIVAFIGRLNKRPLHLIGHSRGASIAYQVALENPGLVSRLILVDPAGPTDSADGDFIRAETVRLISAGNVDAGLELFIDYTSRPGFWKRSASQFQDMARDNAQTLIRQFSDPLPRYRQADAAGLRCPTLLVEGQRSPAMYRENARQLHEWMPGSKLATIAGASHGMTWSHAQQFALELTAFVL